MANWETVQSFGNRIYGIDIMPYKGRYSKNTLILGFDTEYDSKTHELLSIQLANDKESRFFSKNEIQLTPEGKITSKEFSHLLWCFYNQTETNKNYCDAKKYFSLHNRSIILYSYWSVAELQHFVLTPQTLISENPFTYTLKIHQDHHKRIEILDLFVWYQSGLSKFAKDLLNKNKKEYDTKDITELDLLNPKFKEYAVYDAELCYEIATTLRKRFWDLFGIDIVLTQTAANTAAAAFRKLYVTEPITQTNDDVRRQALLSNWGGSSIAYHRGIFKEPFNYYDGVSMYPSCGIELKILPTGKDWFEITDAKEYKKLNGICKVKFKFKDYDQYPCLLTNPKYPFTRQIFPLEGISHTTGKEVKLALDKGADVEVLYGYGYETGSTAFTDFETELKNKKQQSKQEKNKVDTFIYKLMGNSIIGKLKQTIFKDDINDLMDGLNKWGKNYVNSKPKNLNLGSIFMPEWNTLILGYARAIANKAFDQCKAYVGTVDSVITKEDYGKEFIIDNIVYEKKFTGYELGILRAKSYYLLTHDIKDEQGNDVNHVAHHGFHGLSEDFISMVHESINDKFVKYKKYRPVKLRTAIRRNLPFGAFLPVNLNYDMGFDNARILNNDGSTKPYNNISDYIRTEGKYRKELNLLKKLHLDNITRFDYTNEEK